jgi:hypothetical protein
VKKEVHRLTAKYCIRYLIAFRKHGAAMGNCSAFFRDSDCMIERQDEPRKLKDSKNLEEVPASAALKGPALRAAIH